MIVKCSIDHIGNLSRVCIKSTSARSLLINIYTLTGRDRSTSYIWHSIFFLFYVCIIHVQLLGNNFTCDHIFDGKIITLKVLRYEYSTTRSVYIARSISHGTDTSKKRSCNRSFHKCLDHFVLVIEQAKFVD